MRNKKSDQFFKTSIFEKSNNPDVSQRRKLKIIRLTLLIVCVQVVFYPNSSAYCPA